jgi:hypothetical protein
MFGICLESTLKVPINNCLFTIKEVRGPIRRGGLSFPVRIQYASREILLLQDLPSETKLHVLAAAISEACHRHRVPIIQPKWVRD